MYQLDQVWSISTFRPSMYQVTAFHTLGSMHQVPGHIVDLVLWWWFIANEVVSGLIKLAKTKKDKNKTKAKTGQRQTQRQGWGWRCAPRRCWWGVRPNESAEGCPTPCWGASSDEQRLWTLFIVFSCTLQLGTLLHISCVLPLADVQLILTLLLVYTVHCPTPCWGAFVYSSGCYDYLRQK